ncbi:hypothetical protein [Rhizobium leguminosarum]|uniref:hypothetical protein n=1 Tax=Rhizobium leguminosarum TaxID=384 RepID=UPI001C8FC88F|nr:hypothetical protein [Rhizobium leguminosarum]MBY2916924.1 hypothetical protein [Rhizobium leguminosarum]MBY2926388.1 hypothetical protein [Rhizobium leguminosarum]MBY2933461.1 hypothetical protein [Rhizobium leguminosarum]MBY2964347.1 hypothetical protein [Rhizobium leguminosarum]MBY2972160.1 hypothetical protein [Rhizobium leguminosarum]
MTMNSIPSSAKLPPKSLNEDTQDDELPETSIDEQRAPPMNMGNSREATDGVADAAPETGRSDAKTRIPAPQTANRK